MEQIKLVNEKAHLITWTVIYSAMEGFEERRPVVIGIVETLNSRAKIMAPLTDVLPDELKIGMLMEPVIRRIREEGDAGLIYYGIAYRPALVNESLGTS